MRFALAIPALLLLAACGSKEDTITVKDGNGEEATITTKSDDGETTITSDKGKVVINEGGAGASFPAFAPQYPGSTVMGSATFAGTGAEGGAGSMVTQQTSDAPDKVMAFYKAKVTEAGMKIGMETNTPEGGMLAVGTPGEKGGMMITVAKDGDSKTTIAFIGGNGK